MNGRDLHAKFPQHCNLFAMKNHLILSAEEVSKIQREVWKENYKKVEEEILKEKANIIK